MTLRLLTAPPTSLLAALAQPRPLSVLMHEQVQALRSWAQGRCVAAD